MPPGGGNPTLPGIPGGTAVKPQGYNTLNDVWNIMFPTAAGPLANAVNQYGLIQGQMNLLPSMYGEQIGNVQTNEATALKRLSLQNQSIGVQQGAAGRHLALEGKMWPLAKGMHTLNATDLYAQLKDTQRHGNMAIRQQRSQFAGQGSTFTYGSRDASQNLRQDISSQLSQVQRARSKERLSFEGETLQHGERVASLKDEKKQIDLLAKGIGVSYEEIVNRAQQAITQLGLDQMMTTSQLFQALGDASNGIYNALTPITGAVLQTAGLGGAAGSTYSSAKAGPQAVPASTSAFIQQSLPLAKEASGRTGLPVSVILAQWINETGSGSSGGWTKGYNPAGIMTLTSDMKAVGGYAGPNGYVYFPNAQAGMLGYTNRWDDGVYANTRAQWAKHPNDPYAIARDVQNSPWAAGHYGYSGLEGLMRQYNLTQYG